ncbi:hypothetical protein FRB91_006171 [Serendipita sp. 411]|nr:hypothetical protein FRB91_006171 [Serendipita sp. 411]
MKLFQALSFVIFSPLIFTGVYSVGISSLDGRPNGNIPPHPAMPLVALPADMKPLRDGIELPPYSTIYYFDQLIDHKKPELGTFKQRYMFTWEYYQKGGPIILSTPGTSEDPKCRYMAYPFQGKAMPPPVHTIEQAIEDLVYFARNVHLPFPEAIEDGNNVGPDKNPWILVGGSYSGALVSWTMVR